MSCNTETAICINQNATYILSVQLTEPSGSGTGSVPIDITGWEFSASLKEKAKSTDITTAFAVEVLNAESGTFNIFLTEEKTNLLTKSSYVYDLISIISGSTTESVTTRLLEGIATIDPGVTIGA